MSTEWAWVGVVLILCGVLAFFGGYAVASDDARRERWRRELAALDSMNAASREALYAETRIRQERRRAAYEHCASELRGTLVKTVDATASWIEPGDEILLCIVRASE